MGPETTRGLLYRKPPMHLDSYGPVLNAFDAGSIHYLGKWEGLGPGNLDFFGPQMALAYFLDAISRFPGPNPLQLAAPIKSITQGAV
jgi:hypothetical protein